MENRAKVEALESWSGQGVLVGRRMRFGEWVEEGEKRSEEEGGGAECSYQSDVPVQSQGIRYPTHEYDNHRPALRQQPQNRPCL